MLDRGADVNFVELGGPTGSNGHTVLHAAMIAGYVDIVHLLLDHNECLPDKTDWYSQSPFCYACALGRLEIVRLLLETGKVKIDGRLTVDPEFYRSSYRTMTLLVYACIEGHFAVVQYLLQEGQSRLVNEEILGRAIQCDCNAAVNFLLSIGTLQITTCSPVSKALCNGRTAIAKSILTYMCNAKLFVNRDDRPLKNCMQLARERGWDEVLDAI